MTINSSSSVTEKRISKMYLNEVYFWTASIVGWKHLLKPDKYKELIISSLTTLILRRKIKVYGFVIMPNHVHLVWEMLDMNGKELPNTSFMKWTAHQLQADLRINHPVVLERFSVEKKDRCYQFWQRDPLAVNMYSRTVCEQKLQYIHLNPLQAHWNLSKHPEEYSWSSANYYEKGIDRWGMLTHYMDRF